MTGLQRARLRSRPTLMAAATALAVLAITAIGAPAHAASPVTIDFEATGATTVEFGGEWGYQVDVGNTRCAHRTCTNSLVVTFTGDNGKTFTAKTDVFLSETSYVAPYTLPDALPAGTYTITANFRDPYGWAGSPNPGLASSNKPAKLTITAAPLAIDFRIESDPHQSAGAVVNAQLTGTFLDQLGGCYGSEECHEPLGDGRWDFVIADKAGATVVEKSVTAKGSNGQFASFYWHDVPASSDFTATAEFTFEAADRKNYSVEAAAPLSFTSPEAVAAGEPGSPEAEPVAEEVQASPSLPLWAVLAWLLVLVLLAAAVGTFALLARRQRRAATSTDLEASDTARELEKADHS